MNRFLYFFLFLLHALGARASDSAVIFSELHYHPPDDAAETEWIELRSLQGVDVDLSGWRIEGGVSYQFPNGTVLPGGAYLLVARVPGQLPGAMGPWAGLLDNAGEEIRLVNRNGRIMDTLAYGDRGDWPVAADGSGGTLARRDSSRAELGSGAWAASNEIGGTPGTANFLDAFSTPRPTLPVPIAAEWKYSASGAAPPANWKDEAFNDNTWASGPGLLYAGTGKLADAQPPGLLGWWAFEETSGTVAANFVPGGTAGTLSGPDAVFVNDGTRGRVIRLNLNSTATVNTGTSFVSAGTLPAMTMTNEFTWAFWAKTTTGANTAVMVGNRYKPGGGNFEPLEFIKFTNSQLEWYRSGGQEGIDYADLSGSPGAPGPWVHHALVKSGASLVYYRNGVVAGSRTITAAPVNPQPLFFGADGNSGVQEPWSGYLDDVAIWPRALTPQAVAALASGNATPATVPPPGTSSTGIPPPPAALAFPIETTEPLADDFSAAAVDPAKWAVINRGLESNANGGYAPSATGGQLTLGGTTTANFWAGKSLESVARFSTRETVRVRVQRVSLSGAGTGRRSSVWLYGDAGHYVHFAQSPTENGWQYHSSDVGGSGTNQPTGTGVNLGILDGVDANLGSCTLEMVFTPGTYAGEGTIALYRNGVLAGSQAVSNWPAEIAVVLTAQARQSGDSVQAVFDDLTVTRSAPRTLATDIGSAANTAYFRHTFSFASEPATATLALWPVADDGVVYYLNGQEIHRQNMPDGTPTHTTVASTEVTDAFFAQPIVISTTHLMRGTNVLAAEVHQFSPNGGDLLFGAQLNATEIPSPPADAAPALVFNEFGATTDAIWMLELANLSGVAVNLGDYLVRSSAGPSAALSGTLLPGQRLVLDHTQLGFRPADGHALFLVNFAARTVADARRVTNRVSARTANGEWANANVATFGAANSFVFHDQIVINEIMYNAPNGAPEQWIELLNKSAGTVDLSGWRFTDGINLTFPAGTTLGPGEFALVVWDVAAFNALYPGKPRVFGPFSGSLSGRGERVQLRDANENVADEVTYHTSGRWHDFADGGGSSLELRDPHMDNDIAEAWAASDEVARGTWTNVSYTFSGANLETNRADYSELVIGMVAGGEAFIDDIQVVESPGGANISLLANGDFTSGTAATWRFLGNHSRSTVVDDPGAPGNKVLKIVGSGYTEHMSNHCETTLRNGGTLPWFLDPAKTYRISYRARWAGGSNRLHTRLYFNRGARQELLPMPAVRGTPGAPNSRAVANAGPTFQGLVHSPAVPPAGTAATVTVQIADPHSIASASLFYSVNGGGFASVPMSQNAGAFTGTIPGQAASAKVNFYVQATDGLGAVSVFPPGGAADRAMIPWNDGQGMLTLPSGARPHNVRIVMTAADAALLHAPTNVMSNDFIPCTMIYDEREVYYHCGVHLKGSEHGRAKQPRAGFRLKFSPETSFLGRHEDISIDRSGAGDQFSQKEILVKRTINRAGGIPASEDDLCRVIAPQSIHTGSAMLIKTKLDSNNFLDAQFPNGSDGTLFEYERTYVLWNSLGLADSTHDGTWEGLKLTQDSPGPPGVGVRKLNPGLSKEEYRWFWLIKNNRNTDDYSQLIAGLTALGQNAGPAFHAETALRLDVNGWLRSFAGPVAWGIGDNYINNAQHNGLFYTRPDGRLLYIPWDMDFTASQSATSAIEQNSELIKLNSLPANRRAYYGHLIDICNTAFNTSYLTPWAQHYTRFVSEDLTSFMNYVSQREASIRSQVAGAVPNVAFAITTNGGANFTVAQNTTTLQGTGWVNIREIRRADTGLALPVEWTTTTAWQAPIALQSGANAIILHAMDHQNQVIGSASITITNTLNPPAARDHLRITEVHYHPADPSTPAELAASSDANDFEFMELVNTATQAIQIGGCHFSAGITFTFPTPTSLAAGERILVVRNVNAFTARYGSGFRIGGAYGPESALSNSGETITLLDATGALIESFTYGDAAPWTNSADGPGYSLVRRSPSADPTQPTSWRSSVALGGNPGTSDATVFSGDPSGDMDGDGISNLLAYAMSGGQAAGLPVANIEGGFLTFRYRRNLAADDLTFTVEKTASVGAWPGTSAGMVFVSEQHHGDGTATQTWRSTTGAGALSEFVRLRVTRP